MGLASNIGRYYEKQMLRRLLTKTCVKCNIPLHVHIQLSHPFFNDNLEMLEWMDEQQRKTL